MIPTDPDTRAAWTRYLAENAAARREYQRHPLTTYPTCDVCGLRSAANVCRTCKDTP